MALPDKKTQISGWKQTFCFRNKTKTTFKTCDECFKTAFKKILITFTSHSC